MRWSTISYLLPPCLGRGLSLLAACSEEITKPSLINSPETLEADSSVLTAADSAEVLARLETRLPEGLAKVGGTISDTMYFATAVDSFRIELIDRECAAVSNEVTVVNPDTSLLSEHMCQEGAPGLPGQTCWPPNPPTCQPQADPADTLSIWSFAAGYGAGEGVVLDFESGVSGATGQMSITGIFPAWEVSFEDGFDSDFNDFVLSVTAFPADTLPTLSVWSDTLELHPWIDSMTFATDDSTYHQLWQTGDTTTIVVQAWTGTTPSSGDTVTITAELLRDGGGHSHYVDPLDLADLPMFAYSPSPPQHVAGYFKDGTTRTDTLLAVTDANGRASFAFVAGFLGGRVDLLASWSAGGATVSDTAHLTIRVPDLVDLQALGALDDSVYWVGAVTEHTTDSIWYATPSFADSLRALVAALSDPGASKRIAINDATLTWGGSFSLAGNLVTVSTNNEVDVPNVSHHSHAFGVDADISSCYRSAPGTCNGMVDAGVMTSACEALGLFVFVYETGNFHIRRRSELLSTEN